MVKASILPAYEVLDKELSTKELSDLAITPAEIDGIVCALICLNKPCTLIELKSYFIKSIDINKKLSTLLEHVIDYTAAKVTSLDFDFQILLPSEEESLVNRSEALSSWCQGFVLVLKQTATDIRELSSDSQDAIKHMMAIAQLDQAAVSIQEEDERAYVEIVEYLRMVVLMIYSDMHNIETGRTPSKRLH
jgi:uncharacterized protein YgfB (UPF0149 family)